MFNTLFINELLMISDVPGKKILNVQKNIALLINKRLNIQMEMEILMLDFLRV